MDRFVLILKFIILNLFWFISVNYGSRGFDIQCFVCAIFLVALNYPLVKEKVSLSKYLLLGVLFSLFGAFQDGLMLWLGVIQLDAASSLLWLISLWLVFLGYYGDLLDRFRGLSWWQLSAFGAVGGSMAYYGGSQIGNIVVTDMRLYLLIVAISWGIFFPLSMRLFYTQIKSIN